MKETICKIFTQYDYVPKGNTDITIFKHKDWADYWIVVSLATLDTFDQEKYIPVIMEFFKGDKEIKKNMSMVILLECNIIDSEVRDHIIGLENDPYYFKKYIIAYTKDDVDEFHRCVEANDNVLDRIMSPDMFDGLKREMHSNRVGGLHLLYSLSHKLPFLMTNVKLKENKLPNKYNPFSNNKKELYEWVKNIDPNNIEESLIVLSND